MRILTFSQAQEIRKEYASGGVTQAELARRMGVTQACISSTLSGRTLSTPPRSPMTRQESLLRKKRRRVLAKYGLTLEEWEEMQASVRYSCEACGEHVGDGRPHPITGEPFLVIDHNHTTGKVRGVLCSSCNIALGHLKDSPDRIRGLLKYLETRND